jgi:integrase
MVLLNPEFERAFVSYLDASNKNNKTTKKYLEFYHKFSNVQAEITQESVDKFLKYNNYPSARAMISNLKKAVVRWDFPQEIKDSILRIDIPKYSKKQKKKPKFMTYENLVKLITQMGGNSYIDERNRLTILTQWWAGLRIEEVLGLNVDDLLIDQFDK